MQKCWVCSRLETKGVTAYAAAHGNVRYYSQRPTRSFAKPSRLRGMYMLHSSMCFAHGGGATASQALVVLLPCAGTPHYHSQILRKDHSGFAHVGSDGLRRFPNKSKPGITCEHASRACFICHLRMVTSYFKLLLLSYLLPPQ